MEENPNKSPKRSVFSFTIRELLLLTAIVALAAGWCLDRQQLVARLRKWEADWELSEHLENLSRQPSK